MKKNIQYVTQITNDDLKEIAAATDPEPGFCIVIEKGNGTLKIGIDKTAFALALNGFYRNGGMQTDAASCTSVSFDPPS